MALPPGTWGAQLIAWAIDLVLYGMGLILVLQYFRAYNDKDTLFVRCSVGLISFFATSHMVFLSHQIYLDFISWFGESARLNIILFSTVAKLLAIYLTTFTAQIFYGTRIYILAPDEKKIIFATPVFVLALIQMGFGLVQTVSIAENPRFDQLIKTARITSTQAGCTAACDITITLLLCYVLHNSRSASKRTNTAIDRLIKYAINRGAATSIAALVQLILFVACPGEFLFMIFLDPSCQLYVISLTAMLLSREGLRQTLKSMKTTTNYQLSDFGTSEGDDTLASESVTIGKVTDSIRTRHDKATEVHVTMERAVV